jgi:hypothetical protein
MKDWIQEHYDDNLRAYDALQEAIVAAWNAVPETYLLELLESMPARCQAVVDVDGMHTRY